jgi:NitT/TauT family transport system substrate-binding protein
VKQTSINVGWHSVAVAALLFVLSSGEPASAQTKVSILYPVIGPKQVSLWIAEEQGLFAKHGVDVKLVLLDAPVGRRIMGDVFGAIGIPIVLGQAVQGADQKAVAAFNNAAGITTQLVARVEVKRPDDLRGKRFGVNRIGTGIWIDAIRALEHLGLEPSRDGITFPEIGGGALPLVQALEAGRIDAAMLDPSQAAQLIAKRFSLLLDMSTTNIPGIQDALVVAGPYLREHPAVVEKVVAGLVEGIAFSLAPRNKETVIKTLIARLNISSPRAAEVAYQESLTRAIRKPYVSVAAAQDYRRVLALNDPRVLDVKIEDLMDERFVRTLDETGAIDRTLSHYGIK